MKKQTLKYVIDMMLFVEICAISILGLLLGFVIPGGEVGGRAGKYFLGLHRHEWGSIHLYLAIVLLMLLAIHIWLNWGWIDRYTREYFGIHWKQAFWVMCLAWLPILLILGIAVGF